MKKKQDIEDIFQEAFESFSVKPDASVWTNIQSQIPSASAGGSIGSVAGKGSLFSKVIVGAALVGGIATSAYFISRSQDQPQSTTNTESNLPIEQEKDNADPISINVTADSLEHISKEVETEKIKEIEEILEPKREIAKAEKESERFISKKDKKDLEIIVKEKSEKPVEEVKEVLQDETALNSNNNKITVIEPKQPEKISQGKAEVSSPAKSEAVVEQKIAESPAENQREEEKEINAIIPNIFTPNQDGINDVFRIETEDADDLEVAIFDKKGQKLFEWKGLYGFWDGRLPNGQLATADSYFYNIILKKGDVSTIKKGSVLLKK